MYLRRMLLRILFIGFRDGFCRFSAVSVPETKGDLNTGMVVPTSSTRWMTKLGVSR